MHYIIKNNVTKRTYISKNVGVIIIKRTMFSRGTKIANELLPQMQHNIPNVRKMACITGYKVKNPPETCKKLNPSVNDGNGSQHKLVGVSYCEKPKCEEQVCDTACTPRMKELIAGHLSSNSYLPKEEQETKKAILVSETNYKGECKPQWYIKYKQGFTPGTDEIKKHKASSDLLNKKIKSPKDLHDSDD